MAALIPWLKSVHIAALIVWCGCLFALPALYAGFPDLRDPRGMLRHRAMARFTFIAIASPAAVVAKAGLSASNVLLLTPNALAAKAGLAVKTP